MARSKHRAQGFAERHGLWSDAQRDAADAIEKVAGGEKPMLFLEEAHARSIQGPATMDGIGPTQGWEIYGMEVDVKRRRGAPWVSAVPAEIADKVRHLTAAE